MIAIRGIGSSIAKSLLPILPDGERVVTINRDVGDASFNIEKYFICQGILYGKKRIDQTEEEISNTYKVNYIQVACMCDSILSYNNNVRICVIGSESGISGSYDDVYADAKKLLHYYVETKRIGPRQQLVCIAPSIIEDSNMTMKRIDVENLSRLRIGHPKKRFLTSMEVARLVKFLLYEDLGYITGTVIRMNGGKNG